MGLILNTISGSSAGERGALSDRPVIGVTGSMVFHPDSGIQAASPDGTAGKSLADLHRDAAYIFSGSAGGDDRTIFLGDVVISGSLTATVAGGVDGSGGANQVVTWVDADTVDGDSDFTYDATADSNNGELVLGAADSSTTRINFQNGGLKVGPIAPNVGGLAGAADFTTVVSGSAVAISGSNIVSIGGSVTLGPEGSDPLLDMTNHVVHTIRGHQVEISGSAGGSDTDGANSAIRLRAGKQIHLDAVADSTGKIFMTAADYDINAVANVDIDSTAGSISLGVADGGSVTLGRASHNSIVVTPHATAGNEKTAIVNTAGTAADAIKIDAESGGLTLASGADVLSLDADGTGADALKMDSAGGIDISSTGAHPIDIESTNAAGHISLKTAHTAGVAVHIDADANAGSIVDIDAGILQIDATGVAGINSGGTLSLGTANSGVAVNIGHGTSVVTIGDDLVVTGDLTVSGDTVTQNVATVTVEDPLIKLASGNGGGDTLDIGFYGLYDIGSTDKYAGLFRDTNDGHFHLFKDLEAEPTTVVNKSGAGYAVATLVANLTGDVTGTSSKVTVTDSTANTDFPVVFHDEGNAGALLDDTSTLIYNPSTGLLTAPKADFDGGVTIDNITIDGTEIDLSSGDLTVDVAGDILLNAGGGDIQFQKAAVVYLQASESSQNAIIKPGTDEKDIIFQEFGGTEIFRVDETAQSILMGSNKKIELGHADESIRGDGTDIHFEVGANGDINIPANIGLTFGNDGEKIEGDGTDLTVVGNNINLTATLDVNIPSGVGLTFATAEKIESDGTDLSITVGAGGDVNLPSNIGLTFGDDGEKIEGDGTDLTVASSGLLNLNADKIILGNHTEPTSDNALDLGAADKRFRNIYTGDLNLRNDRGDWTLIEEEDFISFRNNVTGRRFRMVMEDITGLGNYGPGNDGEM